MESPATWPAALVALRCSSLKFAGTVTTASVMLRPRRSSAMRRISRSTRALTSVSV